MRPPFFGHRVDLHRGRVGRRHQPQVPHHGAAGAGAADAQRGAAAGAKGRLLGGPVTPGFDASFLHVS